MKSTMECSLSPYARTDSISARMFFAGVVVLVACSCDDQQPAAWRDQLGSASDSRAPRPRR
jgi:hypothetical protein